MKGSLKLFGILVMWIAEIYIVITILRILIQ
jgi:hypothetical protein